MPVRSVEDIAWDWAAKAFPEAEDRTWRCHKAVRAGIKEAVAQERAALLTEFRRMVESGLGQSELCGWLDGLDACDLQSAPTDVEKA